MSGLLVASLIAITLINGTIATLYAFKRTWLDI